MKDLLTGIVAAAFSAFYLMQTSGIKVFGGATAGVTAQTVPRLWGVAMRRRVLDFLHGSRSDARSYVPFAC